MYVEKFPKTYSSGSETALHPETDSSEFVFLYKLNSITHTQTHTLSNSLMDNDLTNW
jgi:hypothetical protein